MQAEKPNLKLSPPYCESRQGAALVLIMVLIVALICLGGLTVNWSYINLVNTEMQIATDASARAANRVYVASGDLDSAVVTAQMLAEKNLVNAAPLQFRRENFELGNSVRKNVDQRYQFTPTSEGGNALRVSISKSEKSPSGAVELIFPMFNGRRTVDIHRQSISTQLELDIVLVIDRSGSMAYAANEKAEFPPIPNAAPFGWFFGDPAPRESRWLDTVDAVKLFLMELKKSPQNEHVALVSYADNAKRDVALTTDYDQILTSLGVYTARFESGGTNIGDGMRQAMNHLTANQHARPWATKVVIVMTDGIYNRGPNPVSMAGTLAKNGVMIFTVTFSDEANRHDMRRAAERGGGESFHASTAEDLKSVFAEIAKRMPTLISK